MIIEKEHLNKLSKLEKVVFATGCFNLYHPGHVYFLSRCKGFGKTLVVAVAHDDITKIKRTPALNQAQRMYVVNSHESVDYVVPEDNQMPPDNVSDLFARLEPSYWVTNQDNPNLDVYRQLMKGTKTLLIAPTRRTDGLLNISTTEILKRIREIRLFRNKL